MTVMTLLLVGVGGFFGAIARLFISQFINKKLSLKIPAGTLFINLLGSFLLGVLNGLAVNEFLLLLIGTGFMGAFTTFSTFNLEGIQLYINKKKKEFFTYNLVSYGGGFLFALFGFMLGNVIR